MRKSVLLSLIVLVFWGVSLKSEGQRPRGVTYKYAPGTFYNPKQAKKSGKPSPSVPGDVSTPESIQGDLHNPDFEKLRDLPKNSAAYKLSRKVAFLRIKGRYTNMIGTGFLVGRDLLLTNHHCVYKVINEREDIPYEAQTFEQQRLQNCEVYLEYYEEGQRGSVSAGVKSILKADASLDYALLRLDAPLGNRYGWLALSEATPVEWRDVRIIQHPRGRSKEIVRTNSTIVDVHRDAVHYVADTEGGSSGSPVFSMRGDKVIALHHLGGRPLGDGRMHPNEGILMKAIVPEIRSWLRGDSTSTSKLAGVVPSGMVLIPAGEFQMGSNDEFSNEKPVHTVYVDAFYMDKYEVTNAQYKRFVDANPQWQKSRGSLYLQHWNGNNYPVGKANHPVVCVSWYAAMAYSKWVGKRLPTEAEWEKAARGGKSGLKYPWGNTVSSGRANYGRNVGDTTRVGHYSANGYGLYDMGGNVSEWCLDAYDANFYSSSPRRNPLSDVNTLSNSGLIIDNYTNVNSYRVLRGGTWHNSATALRVAYRFGCPPTNRYITGGFRCARSVSP